MHQRHIPHPPGTFAACSGCQREPKHIECKGRSSLEREEALFTDVETRHQVECCRCGRRTARHTSLGAARAEWSVMYATPPAAARVLPRREPASTHSRSASA